MNESSYHILVVDDEASQREILAGFLIKKKFKITQASSAYDAIGVIKKHSIDLVLSDYKMPGRTGFDLLTEVKSLSPETDIVLMTAFGTIEGAVAAMRAGAFDYISKPIDLDELELLIQRLRERRELLSENKLLREQLVEKYSFEGIIAESASMQTVLSTASRVADTHAPILIRGESGTGKEVIAKVLHFNSSRRSKPFIAVNCAALNENLLESELFGHEKGAFTGADRQHKGRFEAANGGTIFLDEIGDVSLAIQVKLLRVLQEHQIQRVGGTETINIDVRVIAATNKNLEEAIRNKSFREDLFYRLNVITIEIPPLRKRREDIRPLLEYFLLKFSKDHKRKKLNFSKEAWDILLRYDFPGNVREVENIVQRAVILSRNDLITTDDLPRALNSKDQSAVSRQSFSQLSLDDQVEQLEKELIFEALRIYNNNQSKAAQSLGLSERNLRYRLKKWGVK